MFEKYLKMISKKLKYAIAIALCLLGLGVLIAGILLSNTPMIIGGLFTAITGCLIAFFVYMQQ